MVDIITYCYICQPKSYLPFCVSVVYKMTKGGHPTPWVGHPMRIFTGSQTSISCISGRMNIHAMMT